MADTEYEMWPYDTSYYQRIGSGGLLYLISDSDSDSST